MRRPQFSLKTLLWLMAVVAAFFAGAAWNNRRWQDERQRYETSIDARNMHIEIITNQRDALRKSIK